MNNNQPKRIAFDEFARHLTTVFDAVQHEKRPVLVERRGQLFRVEQEHLHEPENIWEGYDAERVRAGLRTSAGALRGLDEKGFLADMKEQREQDSAGRPA